MSFFLFLLSVIAGPASSAIYWLGFSWRDASFAKTVAKAVPMGVLFIWLWVFADDVGTSPIPWVVLAAWIGDIAISREGRGWFLTGMAAFAVAHLGLIAVFADLGFGPLRVEGAVVVGVVSVLMALALWSPSGALRWPVLGYIAVIAAMGIAGLAINSGVARVDQTVIWGLWLFILSDVLLAMQVFLAPKRRTFQIPLSLLIWPPYYSAMVMFAAAAPG